jgi:hypothetical protein
MNIIARTTLILLLVVLPGKGMDENWLSRSILALEMIEKIDRLLSPNSQQEQSKSRKKKK